MPPVTSYGPEKVSSTHPKFKYHRDKPQGLLVRSAEAEADLGEGWVDHPDQIDAPDAAPAPLKKAAAARLAKDNEAK